MRFVRESNQTLSFVPAPSIASLIAVAKYSSRGVIRVTRAFLKFPEVSFEIPLSRECPVI